MQKEEAAEKGEEEEEEEEEEEKEEEEEEAEEQYCSYIPVNVVAEAAKRGHLGVVLSERIIRGCYITHLFLACVCMRGKRWANQTLKVSNNSAGN